MESVIFQVEIDVRSFRICCDHVEGACIIRVALTCRRAQMSSFDSFQGVLCGLF